MEDFPWIRYLDICACTYHLFMKVESGQYMFMRVCICARVHAFVLALAFKVYVRSDVIDHEYN